MSIADDSTPVPPPGTAEVSAKSLSDRELSELKYRPWLIGRTPTSTQDWLLEVRLLDDDVRRRSMEQPIWLLGRPPENPEEVEAEVRLRSVDSYWKVDDADRRHRAELEFEAAKQASRGDDIRSYVLLAVVAAVVLTPVYAMIANVQPEAFGQYIAPITGIAGTIIGYWFGQRSGQTTVITPPTPSQNRPIPDSSNLPGFAPMSQVAPRTGAPTQPPTE